MLIPSYFNYLTSFKAQAQINATSTKFYLDRSIISERAACYNSLLIKLKSSFEVNPIIHNLKVDIFMNTSEKFAKEKAFKNLIVLKKTDIILWLNYLKSIVDFSYTLRLLKKEDIKETSIIKKGYILSIETKDKTYFQNLFILTLIKALYESPFTYVLLDCLLWKKRVLGTRPLLEFYMIVLSHWAHPKGHSILQTYAMIPSMYTIEKIKQNLESPKTKSLHDCCVDNAKSMPSITNRIVYNEVNCLSREGFEVSFLGSFDNCHSLRRCSLYIETDKILKLLTV